MGRHDNPAASSRRLTVDWYREISVRLVVSPRPTHVVKDAPRQTFCTGSSYEGQVDALGFAGFGSYVYPHGALYEGYFRDGQFHGDGTITYPNGDYVDGVWVDGRLENATFNFADGLKHETPWKYCEFPDRLFQEEENALTLDKELPRKYQAKIPPNCYFTGDGFYRPEIGLVYSNDGKVLRAVSKKEETQIRDEYRKEADSHVNYMERLYEFWTSGKASDVEEVEKAVQRKALG